MCQDLHHICSFVDSIDSAPAVGEVIRVVCGSCGRAEVCPSVTDEEFDFWSSSDESSNADQ